MAKQKQVGFGIDFGTTNSVVGVCEGGPTRALLDGDKPNPSVVWYTADGKVTVGRKAKSSLNGYSEVPGNTFVNSVKLHLGKARSFRVAGQPKSASDVASEIFAFLLHQAKEQHALDVPEGVVTIPVDFDGAARHELRSAAERAGFYVKTFIHEPFAAVVAYCFPHHGRPIEEFEGRNILVFDWGGGTLDITLAAVRSGRMIQVAKADLGHRAGDYFDEKVLRLSHHRFLESSNLSLEDAPVSATLKDRYLGRCEAAKLLLSEEQSADLDVTSAFRVNGKIYDVTQQLTRDDFEAQVGIDVRDAMAKVDSVIDEARLTPRDVDLVLLIGGSSRIPLVRREMQERFGSRVIYVKNADTIIAEGAARVDYLGMQPVLARSLGVRLADGAFYELFPAGTMAKPGVCEKRINFFCTDNRDGEAKLVLVEKYEGREMNERVLGIPVSPLLPRKYNDCERVTVTLSLDEDLILRVFGKGATQERSASAQYHDLLFALDTQGVRS
jgi:molecular chaperone DnaK (HSP70)